MDEFCSLLAKSLRTTRTQSISYVATTQSPVSQELTPSPVTTTQSISCPSTCIDTTQSISSIDATQSISLIPTTQSISCPSTQFFFCIDDTTQSIPSTVQYNSLHLQSLQLNPSPVPQPNPSPVPQPNPSPVSLQPNPSPVSLQLNPFPTRNHFTSSIEFHGTRPERNHCSVQPKISLFQRIQISHHIGFTVVRIEDTLIIFSIATTQSISCIVETQSIISITTTQSSFFGHLNKNFLIHFTMLFLVLSLISPSLASESQVFQVHLALKSF